MPNRTKNLVINRNVRGKTAEGIRIEIWLVVKINKNVRIITTINITENSKDRPKSVFYVVKGRMYLAWDSVNIQLVSFLLDI